MSINSDGFANLYLLKEFGSCANVVCHNMERHVTYMDIWVNENMLHMVMAKIVMIYSEI